MKPLLSIILLALPMLFLAQNNSKKDIPQAVKDSFQKQYPGVEEAKWEKEGENYEVEFHLNKLEQSVVYDSKGDLMETEIEIGLEQLPKNVNDYVNSHYKGQKIKEASKITDAKGTITYEAEIKGMDLIFDSNGGFIKEVK